VFLLTAGHCFKRTDQEVWRAPYGAEYDYLKDDEDVIGTVARNAFQYIDPGEARTGGEAIRITQGGVVPIAIWGWEGHPLPTKPAMRAKKGNVLCFSGAISKMVSCGRVVVRSRRYTGSAPFYAVGRVLGQVSRGQESRKGRQRVAGCGTNSPADRSVRSQWVGLRGLTKKP